jgi:HK97 family phage major capsid protein
MDRAVGLLEIRAVDAEQRTFEGIANSAAVDSYETIIEPAGATFKLPLPLFFHDAGRHDHGKPIGSVIATEIRNGMRWVRARIPAIADDGTDGGRSVKARVDAAWADIKNGLVRGLSIDFIPLEPRNPRAGSRITRWSWHGLTVTPIPSNTDATILAVRSAFASLAALGDPTHTNPGVSGPSLLPRNGHMTIAETITQHENSRAAKVAQKQALMDKAEKEGRTLDATESESFDTLTTEVRSIDEHLTRLTTLKLDTEKKAVPVNGTGTEKASESRSGVPIVRTRPNTEPGIGFARYVMSLVACKGSRSEAAAYARERWGDAGEEIAVAHRSAMMGRAAVAPGTTVQATFAAPLVHVTFMEEMLELLRASTLVERIPGLRRVPFNISMPAQTAGGTYKWVGEGKLKPVTNAQFSSVALALYKASGIIVLTEELVRSSAPSAELVVRNELRDGITRFLDLQFIDPAVAAVATVNPASITNGVAGTAASGTTEAAARADLRALIKTFVTNNIGLDGVVLLMNQSVAFTLGTIVNAVGAPAFPGITAQGGNILGIPVVTSNTITAAVGIIGVHAPSILLADEGGIEIDVSREASLHLDSAPTDPPDATAVYTSLWQANLVGLRVERFIAWGKARSTAVDRIHTVAYA